MCMNLLTVKFILSLGKIDFTFFLTCHHILNSYCKMHYDRSQKKLESIELRVF